VRAAADEIASRVPRFPGHDPTIDAHTCEYRTGDDDLRWPALRVAMLGVEVQSRPSWSRICGRRPSGSSAPRRRAGEPPTAPPR
jgi:hypothetical protein